RVRSQPQTGSTNSRTSRSPPPPRTGRADFPHPALAKVSRQSHSQRDQSEASKVAVEAFVDGELGAALTSPLKMLRQSAQHIGIAGALGVAWVAQAELLRPTARVDIEA